MVKNYITTAIRNLRKHRLYALINLVSLSFGLALSLTALSYVVYEFTWEDCHEHHDRIYRVEAAYTHGDTVIQQARMMAPLGPAIAREIPGVDRVATFRHYWEASLKVGDQEFTTDFPLQAGPGFFEVFTVPLKTGDVATALSEPYSALISDSLAGLLFPGQEPMGQVFTVNDSIEWRVTGVLENVSRHTQVHTDLILSYSTLQSTGVDVSSWSDLGTDLTYLLLEPEADPGTVEALIPGLVSQRLPAELAERYSFHLKPLDEIYFDTYFSGVQGQLYPGGEWEIIYMLSAIGLFVLIQAVANFVNLSTARAADRSKEVGVRKTFGAERSHLLRQFLGESLMLTFAAAFVGLGFYEFFRQGLRVLLPGQELASILSRLDMGLASLALVVAVGVVAGFYPAVYLSRYRPVAVLQSRSGSTSSRSVMRRVLVVFQFTLAIIFVISTVIIYRQQTFVFNTDLGFDKDNMLILRLADETAAEDGELIKSEIQNVDGVLGTTRCNHVLGTRFGWRWFWTAPEQVDSTRINVKYYAVDYDFLTTMGLEVTDGRWFVENRPEDIDHAVLISEAMVTELGIDQPIGYRLYSGSRDYEVVGVLKDFHGASMDFTYRSMSVVTLKPSDTYYLYARLPADDIAGSVVAIRRMWEQVLPNQEFTYSFLDEDIRAVYHEMADMIRVFGVLAVISIGIACLGIFGLVCYTAQQKTKEIGIRKVLGASVARMVMMLAREFVVLIVIANVIAWPLAYLFMSSFLQEFPFRVSLGIGTFASGGLLALALALATSGYQSFKAARANPVQALRYE